MSTKEYKLSTLKTLANIFIYFILFLIGDLFGSLIFDFIFLFIKFPIKEIYIIPRMIGSLFLTIFLFWFYTTKILHLDSSYFRINLNIKKYGTLISILLPIFVLCIFIIIGRFEFNTFSISKILLIIIYSMLIALKSGITEEILFRGYIMKLLEDRWNKYIAILVPSFIFSLVHIPSMEKFNIISIILLIVSGTLVGTMFSLITYKWNSISNSALLHTLWNFFIITDIAHITTAQNAYGNPLLSVTIPSNNILLTGGGFGVEASLIAIIGYIITCIFIIISKKNNI